MLVRNHEAIAFVFVPKKPVIPAEANKFDPLDGGAAAAGIEGVAGAEAGAEVELVDVAGEGVEAEGGAT